MDLKKNIYILLAFCIIPFLSGLNSTIQLTDVFINKLELADTSILMMLKQISKFIFIIGLIIAGLTIDKGNRKKQMTFFILMISISSAIIQFFSQTHILIIQIIITQFSLGYLFMAMQVQLTELTLPKYRGRILVVFISVSMLITIISSHLFSNSFMVSFQEKISYQFSQIPSIFLPLVVLMVLNKFPITPIFKVENTLLKLKDLFAPKYRFVILLMFLFISIIRLTSSNTTLFFINVKDYTYQYFEIANLSSLIGCIITFLIIDKIGRKKLLDYGFFLLLFTAFLIIIISLLINSTMLNFILLSFFEFVFSVAFSANFTLLILEYLPTGIRGKGMMFYAILGLILGDAITVVKTLAILKINISISLFFAIQFITLFITFVIIRKKIKETNGIPLDEIHAKTESDTEQTNKNEKDVLYI